MSMKKFIAICLLVLFGVSAFAGSVAESAWSSDVETVSEAPAAPQSNAYRENMQEINLQYGYLSLPQMAVTIGGVFASIFTGGQVTISNFRSTGVIGLQYYHYIGKGTWAFGADVSYEFAAFDMTPKSEGAKTSQSRSSFISFMPSVKCQWFNRPHFGMYSRLALGVTCDINGTKNSEGVVTSKPSAMFALQANPICMEFGSPVVRGFIEAGFGTQGIIMGGLKYCF